MITCLISRIPEGTTYALDRPRPTRAGPVAVRTCPGRSIAIGLADVHPASRIVMTTPATTNTGRMPRCLRSIKDPSRDAAGSGPKKPSCTLMPRRRSTLNSRDRSFPQRHGCPQLALQMQGLTERRHEHYRRNDIRFLLPEKAKHSVTDASSARPSAMIGSQSCWPCSCRCAGIWLEGQLRAAGGDRVPVVEHRDELASGPGFVLIGVVRARRISRCSGEDDPRAVVPVADVE